MQESRWELWKKKLGTLSWWQKNLGVNRIYFWKIGIPLDNEIFRNVQTKQHFFQSLQDTYKHKHGDFHESSYLPTSTSSPIDQMDLNKST